MNDIDDILADFFDHGTTKALPAYDAIRLIRDAADAALERLKPHALVELGQENGRRYQGVAGEYVIQKGAGKWSYSGVPEHAETLATLKAIEERAKLAYKAREGGIEHMADRDGAETPCATYVPGSDTIALKAK